jgi:Mn2+/Fe2+ NRAMP family transporter
MVLLMLLVSKEKVMGKLTIEGWLYWLGWISTAVMALCIIGMAVNMTVAGG